MCHKCLASGTIQIHENKFITILSLQATLSKRTMNIKTLKVGIYRSRRLLIIFNPNKTLRHFFSPSPLSLVSSISSIGTWTNFLSNFWTWRIVSFSFFFATRDLYYYKHKCILSKTEECRVQTVDCRLQIGHFPPGYIIKAGLNQEIFLGTFNYLVILLKVNKLIMTSFFCWSQFCQFILNRLYKFAH